MADNTRSAREIEREVEQERAELRSTIDQLLGRLTFEDAWERIGRYLRDHRSEYDHTLGRMVKEKPLALALTAVGIGWLLFGPASPASRGREVDGDRPRRVSGTDRDPYSASPPPPRVDPAETLPRASELNSPHRPTPGTSPGAISGEPSGAGSRGTATSSPSSGSTSAPIEPGKSTSTVSSGGVNTSSPTRENPGATPGSAPTSTANEAAKDRPPGAPSAGATATSFPKGEGFEKGNEDRNPAAPNSRTGSSAGEPRPQSVSGSNGEEDETPKPPA